MKLYNTMFSLVNLHKRYCKRILDEQAVVETEKYKLRIRHEYLELTNKDKNMVNLILGTSTNSTHCNNSAEYPGSPTNFLFKVFQEPTITLYLKPGESTTIDLPRYNDNEDELLFQLSTVTSNALSIVASSILMKLDTEITTLYTRDFSEQTLEALIECLDKGEEWISNHIQTHSKH